MTRKSHADEIREYYALCAEAAALGVPTSLDDPASPTTIAGLRLAIERKRMRPGDGFDTEAETGCVVQSLIDAEGNFLGYDSDGELCAYNTVMVTKVAPTTEEEPRCVVCGGPFRDGSGCEFCPKVGL